MKYICDTNYILRYLLADDSNMYNKAKKYFEEAKNGKITLIIELTVIIEVVVVLSSSYYNVPKIKIVDTLLELINYKGIITNKDEAIAALQYYRENNIEIGDSILLARSILNKYPLLSFDQKLMNLRGVLERLDL